MKKRTKVITGAAVAGVAVLAASGAVLALDGDDDRLSGRARDRAIEATIAEVGEGTVTSAERDDVGGYEVEVVRPDGSTVEVHLSSDRQVVRTEVDDRDDRDDDGAALSQGRGQSQGQTEHEALVGEERRAVEAAALAEVPGGIVTEAEREGTGFEVQVVRPDGVEVDVHLDEQRAVVAVIDDLDDLDD